jgi:hypothetical protein
MIVFRSDGFHGSLSDERFAPFAREADVFEVVIIAGVSF